MAYCVKKMPNHLFTIQNVFRIPSRGVIIAPNSAVAANYRAGQHIEMRRPDGTTLRAIIQGIEMLNFALDTQREQQVRPIVLAEEFITAELPEGTEVWLLEDQ